MYISSLTHPMTLAPNSMQARCLLAFISHPPSDVKRIFSSFNTSPYQRFQLSQHIQGPPLFNHSPYRKGIIPICHFACDKWAQTPPIEIIHFSLPPLISFSFQIQNFDSVQQMIKYMLVRLNEIRWVW